MERILKFCGELKQGVGGGNCAKIGLPLGLATVGKFSDGETAINIDEVVRVRMCLLSNPHVRLLMTILLSCDYDRRCKESFSGRITAVIPYFGYASRIEIQGKRSYFSKTCGKSYNNCRGGQGAHNGSSCASIAGIFDIPLDHLLGGNILANYFLEKFGDMSDVVVVSPDVGSVSRSRKFAQRLDVPLAIIDKRRPKANVSEIMNIIGDVDNKRVILVDDLIDTGGTIVNAANALMEIGAKEVYACCTHGLLSGPAIDRIKESPIKQLVTLNTIPLDERKRIDKIVSLSVASVFAEAIERIYGDMSISSLFTQQD